MVVLVRPVKFTLETLWDAIANLTAVVSTQTQQLQSKFQDQANTIAYKHTAIEDFKSTVLDHAIKTDSVRDSNISIMKDLTATRFKLEDLENVSRASNLTFIIFQNPLLYPLKRYFIDI